MLLSTLVACSARVQATARRGEKVAAVATCLRELHPDEIEAGVALLCGELRQGRIGLGYATVFQVTAPAAAEPSLTLVELDRTFEAIGALSGPGSSRGRSAALGALLARLTTPEQDFVRRVLVGELRQGALEGALVAAIAKAAGVRVDAVRRAIMLSGNLGVVARTALEDGEAGLGRFGLELFRPLEPMLAQSAESAAEAVQRLGRAVFDHKLDGARVQIHKVGRDVAVFSRSLKDVTVAVPEIVERVRAIGAQELVLDGEVVALRVDGTPQPFQTTMRRFGRKLEVAAMREELPVEAFFFDCLHLDGESLLDRPLRERLQALKVCAGAAATVPTLESGDAQEVEAFLDEALRRGHEGVMAKSLEAGYAAGNRGAAWLKIKPVHTLDLVVLAAEWGHGRRRGWLSNLHLGARNADGSFTMLGKTFKGMTDAMLRWQTVELEKRALGREGPVVHVRPELVVEVAVGDVQQSPHYPGGLALRFARVKRYRPDKRPEDADTLETVRRLHADSAEAKRKP